MTRDELLAQYAKGKRDFRGAYLGGADLRGADLGGADLRDAYLRDADLGDQWIIQGPTRSDGHQFFLTNLKDEGIRVKAGCRNLTPEQARNHWIKMRGGTLLGNETMAILYYFGCVAKIRGLMGD